MFIMMKSKLITLNVDNKARVTKTDEVMIMTYNVSSSGTLHPTVPYYTIP